MRETFAYPSYDGPVHSPLHRVLALSRANVRQFSRTRRTDPNAGEVRDGKQAWRVVDGLTASSATVFCLDTAPESGDFTSMTGKGDWGDPRREFESSESARPFCIVDLAFLSISSSFLELPSGARANHVRKATASRKRLPSAAAVSLELFDESG